MRTFNEKLNYDFLGFLISNEIFIYVARFFYLNDIKKFRY
jgi:hypothetical protein